MKRPLISIVTATYNSMKFIEETKQSVLGLDMDFEWVVVDDASRDGTPDYIRALNDPRINAFFKQKNGGIEDSYEQGIKLAKGKYILILDHDDTIPEGSLQKRVTELERHPEALLAFGPVAYMDESSTIYKSAGIPLLRNSGLLSSALVLYGIFLLPVYPLKQGCVVLRTDFVKGTKDLYDIQLFLEAARRGPVAFVNTPCLNYRTFRAQFSSSRRMRLVRAFQFVWAKYAFKFLPWYSSPFLAFYRTLPEFGKIVWSLFSSRRI